MDVSKERGFLSLLEFEPIPVAARSKAWVCSRVFAGISGWNPAGVSVAYLVEGPCVGLITGPEESCRMCVRLNVI